MSPPPAGSFHRHRPPQTGSIRRYRPRQADSFRSTVRVVRADRIRATSIERSLFEAQRLRRWSAEGDMPNMRRNVRLMCAASAKPAWTAASVSATPFTIDVAARCNFSHKR